MRKARERSRHFAASVGDELSRVRAKPTAEVAQWAREGRLNGAVLENGTLNDLRTLARMGAKFPKVGWNACARMETWSEDEAREWLTTLFNHGWDGQGHGRELPPLLAVAEYHPALLRLWQERVPGTWHQRHQWLDGVIRDLHIHTPQSLTAWLSVGASFASPQNREDRLNLRDWVQRSTPEQVGTILDAIETFREQERSRRHVRGEPRFRDFPWDALFDVVVEGGHLRLMEDLAKRGQKIGVHHVANAILKSPTVSNFQAVMEYAKKAGWPLPLPGNGAGHTLVAQLLSPERNAYSITADAQALAMELLDQGYPLKIDTKTQKHIQRHAGDALKSHIQACLLRKSGPSKALPSLAAPRRRL